MQQGVKELLSLEFPGVSWLPLGLGLLCAIAAFFLSLRGNAVIENAKDKRRLAWLRAAGLTALIFALLQPALTTRRAETRHSTLAVLLDASPSMTRGKGFSEATDYLALQKIALNELGKRYDLKLCTFSSDTLLDTLFGFPVKRLSSQSNVTRLTEALDRLREYKPAGIVLLTDGIIQDPLFMRLQSNLAPFEPGDAYQECRFYNLPLGVDTGTSDIAVVTVSADEFAYVKNPFSVKVRIRADVPKSVRVPIRLLKNGETMASTEVDLKKGKGEYEADITFTPEQTGFFIYRAEVPSYQFESAKNNNRKDFAFKVIRDRIRVMQIAGRPSWDVRFLRSALKKDPSVDLIAFYILRTASDWIEVPNEELSLIEFPHHELFSKDLSSFDLVIFQNFSYRQFFGPEYLSNIRSFVENGGAFLMTGGDQAFAEGGYRGTPIEAVLPYQLPDPGARQTPPAFSLVMTPDGLSHPITSDLSELKGFKLEGLNPLSALQNRASTLLAADNGAPVLGIRDVGKGRTAAISGDGFWFFNFVNVGEGGGNRSYQEFMRRLTRWLCRDPAASGLSITGIKPVYPEGENIPLTLRTPASRGQSVLLKLVNGEGRVLEKLTVKPLPDKPVSAELKNPGPGIYLVRAENWKNGVLQDAASEALSVSSTAEYGDGSDTRPLLNSLAKATGGLVLSPQGPSLSKTIDLPVQTVKRILDKRTTPLWNHWIALLVAALLFGTEWFIRKRKGLL